MQWKFFLGACFLTGAVLIPHTRWLPLIAGMALAGLLQLLFAWLSGR
jgi:hypothetical protein